MIHLHYSNRLEALLPPLAEAVATRDPFDPVVVIVPNRAIEEFLKLRLAELLGVSANLRFPFLHRYLAGLVSAGGRPRPLEGEELHLLAFECLRAGLSEPQFKAVRDFLDAGSQHEPNRELRLFELAGRAARMLREYSISRRAMLAAWRKGPAPGCEAMREAETWQRHLYLSLFQPDGALRPRWTAGGTGGGALMLPEALAAGHAALGATLANPLHVFALSYIGTEFTRIFARLGKLAEVHIYALNPCAEFWEDLHSLGATGRQAIRHGQKLERPLEEHDDPFGIDAMEEDENLVLRAWGKPGREYIRLLNELTDCDFDSHFVAPLAGPTPPTLLAQVQHSILRRHGGPAADAQAIPPDDSIRFVACPGVRREVELTAHAIWDLIRHSNPPLRFHEIAVLIPDQSLDAYLPQIETLFAQQHEIPLSLSERAGDDGRVAEAIDLLLALPLGQFTREEVSHLILHPALAGVFPEAGREQWETWCEALGIFFGADAADLKSTYLAPDLCHWDQGLRRLALGVFMEEDRSAPPRTLRADGGSSYLPFDSSQEQADDAAGLLRTARGLLSDASALRKLQLPLPAWAPLLTDFVARQVRPVGPAGARMLDLCTQAIEAMAPPELGATAVDYPVAAELARARIAQARAEATRYAENGVVVGTLSALRALPFRTIFVLGLGEAVFPAREARDPLDLRLARRQAGDVTGVERERYLFLETLLAARERIILSWVARDQVTGEPLQMASVLSELHAMLGRFVTPEGLPTLIRTPPASRYDTGCFAGLNGRDPTFRSYDSGAWQGARMAALRRDLGKRYGSLPETNLLQHLADPVRQALRQPLKLIEPPPAGRAAGPAEEVLVLSLTALRRYLECPLQGAARYALRMENEADDDDWPDEHEPLTQSLLERIVMLREALWMGRGELTPAEAKFKESLRLAQLKGAAPTGPFEQAALNAARDKFQLCLAQTRGLELAPLSNWRQIRFGPAEDGTGAELRLAPLALELPPLTPGGPIRHVSLRGALQVSPAYDAWLGCIAGAEAKPKDFLTGFIGAMALAAAGLASGAFQAVAGGGKKDRATGTRFVRTLMLPEPATARAYLTALAADLLDRNNHYFLPIEAVQAVLKILHGGGLRPGEITAAIDDVRENEYQHVRSDYGPVRDARQFKPPPEDSVRAIIARRFGPIRTIFRPATEASGNSHE